jgi:hypothetical protein
MSATRERKQEIGEKGDVGMSDRLLKAKIHLSSGPTRKEEN